MPVYEYTLRKGRGLVYTIEYGYGEYFIHRDGEVKNFSGCNGRRHCAA
jgi:ribosomal protein L24E